MSQLQQATTAKTFDPDGRYIVGIRARTPMPGKELVQAYPFTGREVIAAKCRTTDQFFSRNPFKRAPDKHVVLMVIDRATGNRAYFDEGRFRSPAAPSLSDSGRMIGAGREPNRDAGREPNREPNREQGRDMTAPGMRLTPPLAPSLAEAQAQALTASNTSQVVEILKAELSQRNREIELLRDELRGLYQDVAAAHAQKVFAQAELQKHQEIRAKEDQVVRSMEEKMKREFADDVQFEAAKLAKRQGQREGLGDSMGSLLTNPAVVNLLAAVAGKFFGGDDTPAAAQPVVTSSPSAASDGYVHTEGGAQPTTPIPTQGQAQAQAQARGQRRTPASIVTPATEGR